MQRLPPDNFRDPLNAVFRFESLRDYREFERQLLASLNWKTVPVREPYANIGIEETWHLHIKSDAVYRLLRPDAPFYGLWEPAEND